MICTESWYTQIEKEVLAATWMCEKFATYIQRKTITLETDHKPLVPLQSNQHLDKLQPRVLRFCLRLTRFDYVIKHVPGKSLHTVTSPSWVYSRQWRTNGNTRNRMSYLNSCLTVSNNRLTAITQAQANEPVCNILISYCSAGWPVKSSLPDSMKPYRKYQGELSVHNNLLLYQNRLVIPNSSNSKAYKSFITATKAFNASAYGPSH